MAVCGAAGGGGAGAGRARSDGRSRWARGSALDEDRGSDDSGWEWAGEYPSRFDSEEWI